MAKKETDDKQKRKEALQDATVRFHKMLLALIVVDALTKSYILDQYNKTVNRLSSTKINSKTWPGLTNKDLWAEYEEVEKQLGMLSIFSDKFFQHIRSNWDHMLSTFNPNVNY